MKYKAIISDIDGTIAETRTTNLPTERVSKSIKLANKSILFSVATGRPFHLIQHLAEHLDLTAPLITDNGAVIVDAATSEILWEASLSQEEAIMILAITKKYALTRVSCNTINLENPTVIPQNVKVYKVSIHDLTSNEADELIKELELNFKNLAIVKAAAFKGIEFFDVYISHAEATKQHAVLKFAEILGIKTEEMIGIGDHYNDFPLLMACGLKVAMGNAVPELKEIADYIAPSVEEDGVADVIEKFILN